MILNNTVALYFEGFQTYFKVPKIRADQVTAQAEMAAMPRIW